MKLKVEKGKLRLSFSFDRKKIEDCKRMGMRWSRARKDWFMTDNYINRVCLDRVFPKLIPSPAKPQSRELTIPDYLMSHQRDGFRCAARHPRWAFFFDTGTGKTLLGLEIYKLYRVKTLVVCPLSLVEGAWLQEIEKWNFGIDSVNLWQAKKKGTNHFKEALTHDFCVINYESFSRVDGNLADAGFKMVILDESARIRNPKTTTFKKIVKFCDNIPHVYELSGLPAPNSSLEYWAQIRILDPLIWPRSYYKFRLKYFVPTEYGKFNWQIKKDCADTIKEDIRKVATYVDKKDVLDLPEKSESMRIFCLSEEEIQRYRDIKTELVTILDSGETITAQNSLVAIMKLRQVSSGFLMDEGKCYDFGESKLNELAALLEDIGRKQVIIWTQFKHEAKIIAEMLKGKDKTFGVLNGSVSERQKQITLRRFKEGNLQYVICHPRSVGYGHTLVNCHEVIHYSFSYSYENLYQANDRVYRHGQLNACSYYYLIARNTADLTVLKAVQKKGKASNAILNYLKRPPQPDKNLFLLFKES